MWPYNESEAEWLGSETNRRSEISHEMIRHYMREGERLRARAIADAFRALGAAISESFRSARQSLRHLTGGQHAGFFSHHE